ncbi:DUF2530 domain-containing protein [Knoellia subterranea]|uniref:DUF2530 domain-containing protein n=1 Tax=Knoellia subterranea KCTC 19937 TaxID=1385521 RepID=A0A0A0JKR7_9MICO|nr:DUF2530 domain-containing protein [Knoellia subterranea]KGN36647.1 hypothetical protein N803_04130 [Knoellia subterranea KCTC 19937]
MSGTEGSSERWADGIPDPSDSGAPSSGDLEALEAMHVPTQRIITIGLALWAAALVVTLVVPALHSGSRDWWPWACVAGLGLGSVGLLYVRRGRGNASDAH